MKIQKKIFILILMLISILSYTTSAYAETTNADTTTSTANVQAPNFTIYSEGAILMDANTGITLYGKNENKKLYPASTTKILTAIIAIENCKPTDKITASYNAVMSIPAGYSNAAIQPGETLTMQELLEAFLIHSANEVGYIFAEHISGSIENFATLMNQKATSLGCTNTHFTNPSGIHDAEHYSTAYDMALIARYCMQNETFRNTVSKTSCTIEATDKYEKRYFKNTNDLLLQSSKYYYEYAIGIKTGYTSQAKRCLIASSLKDNLELITVTLGAESTLDDRRYEDTINLFEYGFSNYKFQNIATKGTSVQELVIENATKETQNLSLQLKENLSGTIPANINLSDVTPTIKINDNIVAPIQEGTILGKITYKFGDFEYSTDLIASHDVEEFDVKTMLYQIILALFVLFILSKLILPKKKSKKKISKNSKSKKKYKSKKSNDSIYKF